MASLRVYYTGCGRFWKSANFLNHTGRFPDTVRLRCARVCVISFKCITFRKSLCPSWHDPVVWAHYSDKHRGLCLGFEIPEEVGTEVHYISGRLSLPQKLALDDATAWVFTKYENWSYEQEIRCCARLDEASDGLYFLAFGETLKLVEVIVGARCDLTEQMISEALRPFCNVPIIKAGPSYKRFEIVEDRRGFP